MQRGTLLVVVTALASLALIAGTGGSSSITAVPSVDITTTAAGDGLLGVEQTTRTQNGTTELTLTVRNQHVSQTTFTAVEVSHDGATVDVTDGDPLGPGTTATHTFTEVDCDRSVQIEAAGTDVAVQIEREIDCGS